MSRWLSIVPRYAHLEKLLYHRGLTTTGKKVSNIDLIDDW